MIIVTNLTSEENETLKSKSGTCNLTSFVNDHIQKSKFKNYRGKSPYRGKPPSKVEFDMNNSVVIVHRNPLLEKFVSENLPFTESNSSYLFPISVSEFKSDLQNSKKKDYTLENKIMENGSISNELGMQDVVTIKEEPVNFDDYEVYGMGNSNSNLKQWVIDAFERVISKKRFLIWSSVSSSSLTILKNLLTVILSFGCAFSSNLEVCLNICLLWPEAEITK
ncbi:UNVERIFIED_CONTAM: hypothetical protein RMT77_008690 [Armadillidium vulgare]